MRLLVANYDLSPDEAATLALATPAVPLVLAVEAALFGRDDEEWTYNDWITCSLWANGIDPDRVPPGLRRRVVNYLVELKKALPAHEAVSSAAAVAIRAGLIRG